jgi:hypothetical protein
MSHAKAALLQAYKKGYRVKDNVVYGIIKKQPLKLSCSQSGYLFFNIKLGSRTLKVFLHRLVAYEKYQDKLFEPGILVRHLNGNSKDNSFENISIGTQTENMLDRSPEERLNHAIKASSFKRKFTNEKVSQIKLDHANGLGYKALMEKYCITSKGTLHYILTREYVT